ncbi:MAG TPA: YrrS family protein [Bacillota bacterium]|nr:YrrS family protein [Bacillota bacterium]
MTDNDSRSARQDKRRKNNRLIVTLISLGSILAILLIAMLVIGSDNDDESEQLVDDGVEESEKEDEEEQSNDDFLVIEEDENNEEQSEQDEEDEEEVSYEHEHVDSDDDNVLEAYKANWDPIGTSQTEPHTVNFDEDSKDREEMKKAIQIATELDEMVIWWIGNDGDQKVTATVSPMDESLTYRVYLTWEENHGWKPTLVEQLVENDKK